MLAPGSEVIEAIAYAQRQCSELKFKVRNLPEVQEVDCDLWLSPSTEDRTISMSLYLDVGLTLGPGVVFDIDATRYEIWSIDAEVRFVYGEDAETLTKLPTRRAGSGSAFATELRQAVDDLVALERETVYSSLIGRYPCP